MIEKKEDQPPLPDALVLAQTYQLLEANMQQVQAEVRSTFARLAEALQSREKQLLRQIDVAHSQQLAYIQAKAECSYLERMPDLRVQMSTEKAVKEAITALGSVSLDGAGLAMLNGDGTFLQSLEDYQDANQDHMSMFKPVPLNSSISKTHEAVIRFNHISLPQSYSSSSESSSKPEEETDSSTGSMKDCESVYDDTETDKVSLVTKVQHPAQVQQWLKQLSAETETEPSVGEPKNFGPVALP